MTRECKITQISIDDRMFILRHAPVDWDASVEGDIKKGNTVIVKLKDASTIYVIVRSGREGTVIAFDSGRITLYSNIPTPPGFHSR
mgnify:FL=1